MRSGRGEGEPVVVYPGLSLVSPTVGLKGDKNLLTTRFGSWINLNAKIVAMKYAEVIIIGGGPAGSTCAWKLKQRQVDCLLLDAKPFPRPKLCAGWLTQKTVDLLELSDYPNLQCNASCVNVFGLQKKLRKQNYSVRRYEFDDWLLKRSGVEVHQHKVRQIKQQDGLYSIDDTYKCKYLVGAGGTHCPVYRTFFKQLHPRNKQKMVCTLEQEIKYDYPEKQGHTWLFENNFHGYAWCVPKKGGYLNIGVGGLFKGKKANIKAHWDDHVKKLDELGIVSNVDFAPQGYVYYLRDRVDHCRVDNAFIIGDAAGLATKDLGEGIGPAVESAMLAAASILDHTPFSLRSVTTRNHPVLMRILLFLRPGIQALRHLLGRSLPVTK